MDCCAAFSYGTYLPFSLNSFPVRQSWPTFHHLDTSRSFASLSPHKCLFIFYFCLPDVLPMSQVLYSHLVLFSPADLTSTSETCQHKTSRVQARSCLPYFTPLNQPTQRASPRRLSFVLYAFYIVNLVLFIRHYSLPVGHRPIIDPSP